MRRGRAAPPHVAAGRTNPFEATWRFTSRGLADSRCAHPAPKALRQSDAHRAFVHAEKVREPTRPSVTMGLPDEPAQRGPTCAVLLRFAPIIEGSIGRRQRTPDGVGHSSIGPSLGAAEHHDAALGRVAGARVDPPEGGDERPVLVGRHRRHAAEQAVWRSPHGDAGSRSLGMARQGIGRIGIEQPVDFIARGVVGTPVRRPRAA
jgi:hypothetical protein